MLFSKDIGIDLGTAIDFPSEKLFFNKKSTNFH